MRHSLHRDQESSNILDFCDDAVMVVPGLPEKEPDMLCHSFILEEQVILLHESMPYLWKCVQYTIVFCVCTVSVVCVYVFHLVGVARVCSA